MFHCTQAVTVLLGVCGYTVLLAPLDTANSRLRCAACLYSVAFVQI